MSALPAFLVPADDGTFVPRPEARSPWSPDMLHGRLLAGLAARVVDREHRDGGFRPARLTIDLFRSPAMEPISVAHRRLRDGGRVRVVEVDLQVGGHHVARTSIVLLRTGEHPDGERWTRDDWDVPTPDQIEVPEPSATQSLAGFQIRAVGGRGFGTVGQKQVWLRDERPLVDGEGLGPFERVAMASDFASPLGNSGSGGLAFINADITLYLGRLPTSEWIGIEIGAHVGADAIAVARGDLFDLDGAVGFVDVCAVANAMMSPTPPPPSEGGAPTA